MMFKLLFVGAARLKRRVILCGAMIDLVCFANPRRRLNRPLSLSYTGQNSASRMAGAERRSCGSASRPLFDEWFQDLNAGDVSLEARISTVIRGP